tara:strand:- start:307 stop:450 length:144 start_codon:yes stop_codon:yes gene_type:complete
MTQDELEDILSDLEIEIIEACDKARDNGADIMDIETRALDAVNRAIK